MFTKLLLSVVLSTGLLASTVVLAQETNTSTESGKAAQVLDYIKSKFSFSYYGEYVFNRGEDNKLDTALFMHIPTIVYRPIKNWRFIATSEFKYAKLDYPSSYINQHYRSLFIATRENLLTEADNGVKLDVGVARRVMDQAGKPSSFGNSRLIATLSKSFTPDFSTRLNAQYLLNDATSTGKKAPSQWKHALEVTPSFSWQVTKKFSWFFNNIITVYTPENSGQEDKLSISHEMNLGFWNYQFNDTHGAYFQFRYVYYNARSFQRSFQNQKEYFDYCLGHTYSFTPKMSLTTELTSILFKAGDGKDFLAEDVRYPALAVLLSVAL